jgi:hypothetical protein
MLPLEDIDDLLFFFLVPVVADPIAVPLVDIPFFMGPFMLAAPV